jgi:lipopolysaccharide assembly protein A
MQVFIIIALLIAIVAVVFALQNLVTVSVSFLFWSLHGSLALVLLVTLLVGVLISLLASLPGLVRGRMAASSQKKKLAALESERSLYQQKAEAAEKEVKALEEQVASYTAELNK